MSIGRIGKLVSSGNDTLMIELTFTSFAIKTVPTEAGNMGALAAAVSKQKENVVPTVASMLQELSHRGKNGHGLATPDSVKTTKTANELKTTDLSSRIVLGHNFSATLPRDIPQPVLGNGFTAVFEGRLFPAPEPPQVSEVEEITRNLKDNPLTAAERIPEKREGSYVFAVAQPNRLLVGRDFFGATPL